MNIRIKTGLLFTTSVLLYTCVDFPQVIIYYQCKISSLSGQKSSVIHKLYPDRGIKGDTF